MKDDLAIVVNEEVMMLTMLGLIHVSHIIVTLNSSHCLSMRIGSAFVIPSLAHQRKEN